MLYLHDSICVCVCPSQPFHKTVWPLPVRLSKGLHNGPSVKSTGLTRAPLQTSHTHTLMDTHSELGTQCSGSRLQTHNTDPPSFCYTILRPTLTAFPTFTLFRLTAHLSGTTIYFGSSVLAKYRLQCVEHITGRGPFETGCVLV